MEMMPEAADEALAFANTELRLRRMPGPKSCGACECHVGGPWHSPGERRDI
jgi:hypothetical protein